ncbi:MAG TPA: hypothetical protein VKX49_06060 [Bryobacteraceae bacterium]|nr:hypothetical protein [Bryobacteraceae bacterium]
MPKERLSFAEVRKIAAGMPGVEESTIYGSPALKVAGGLMACIPTNKSAEPNSLVACVGFEVREDLLRRDPQRYYLKPHYENSPVVLARLSRMDTNGLRDLLEAARRFADANRVSGSGRVQRRIAGASRRKRH